LLDGNGKTGDDPEEIETELEFDSKFVFTPVP